MGKLVILVGLARSGKSTYSKEWLNTPDPDGLHKVVVNADSIRLALHGQRFLMEREGEVHRTAELMIKTLFLQGCYSILCDETNTTAKNLRKWFRIDPHAEVVYLNTSRKICKERAYATEQDDLVNKGVIDRMFDNLVKLVKSNHFVNEKEFWDLYTDEQAVSENFVYAAIEGIRGSING